MQKFPQLLTKKGSMNDLKQTGSYNTNSQPHHSTVYSVPRDEKKSTKYDTEIKNLLWFKTLIMKMHAREKKTFVKNK